MTRSPTYNEIGKMTTEQASAVYVALEAHLPIIAGLVKAESDRLAALPEKDRNEGHLRRLQDDLWDTLRYTRWFRRQRSRPQEAEAGPA